MADANPGYGELKTPYTRRIHKICSKMSDAELSEFPDVLCVRDAHALVFGAAVDLTRPGLPLVDCLSASGRYLRGCRLGLATGLDLPAPPPSSLYEALRALVSILRPHANCGHGANRGHPQAEATRKPRPHAN